VAEDYREFGTLEAVDSPCFRAWSLGVAADPEVLALLDTLPPAKRQPNLVFAAARWHGARPGGYDELRPVLLERWDDVRATVLDRATQTNEVGRCAPLLPVLGMLSGPLALLEVGASAGLCLYPDRYSYRYTGSAQADLDPADGPSPVVLGCVVEGDPPMPPRLPDVVWRGGIDLNPLDVHDDDAMRWLETLVWPEHEDRRARLAAAVRLARADPPTLVRGDLVEQLPALVERVPQGATLVVFHSSVLGYLEETEPFSTLMTGLMTGLVTGRRGHWVSNEGPRVLPAVASTAPSQPPPGSPVGRAPVVTALDGRAVAWAHPHGRALSWLGR
jgi:Uncharacterized protein conserved in bacteria (DUF2332)